MSRLDIEIPESLKRNIAEIAAKGGYTIDQFLASAAAEKIAAMRTLEFLRAEASGARREDFEKFLASVPAQPPIETDRIDE